MSGRPVEAGDRVFGVAGESLRPGGHVLGAGSPKYEVLRSDQKVSYLAHLGVQTCCVACTDSSSDGLLARKKQQTAREGIR